LFVSHTARFDAGGAEKVLYDILRGMQSVKHRRFLCVPLERKSDLDQFGEYVQQIFSLSKFNPGSRETGRNIFTAICSVFFNNLRLVRIVKDNCIDVLYVNTIYALYFSVLAGLITRVKIVYHEHGLVSLRERSLWNMIFGGLVRRVDRIVAITAAVRNELVASGADPERITVVHNWVSGPRFSSVAGSSPASAWRRPEGRYVVAQIANLLRWKGHETVIRALPKIRLSVPNVHLVVFGRLSDQQYLDDLKALAMELGVDPCVEFAGFRDDMERILPRLDCVVLASEAEPFGLVLIEAMVAGVPVVASSGGGVPEIVEHGVNGLLFSPGDSDGLADGVIALALDPGLRSGFVRLGKEIALARFSMQGQVGRIVRIIEEVAEGRNNAVSPAVGEM